MERPKFLGGAGNLPTLPTSGSPQQVDIEEQFLRNHALLMRREIDPDTRIMLLGEQVRLLFARVITI